MPVFDRVYERRAANGRLSPEEAARVASQTAKAPSDWVLPEDVSRLSSIGSAGGPAGGAAANIADLAASGAVQNGPPDLDWNFLGGGNFMESTAADVAARAQANGLNQRFGSDLSWLDPTFQYSPTVLGQSAGSQAYADPNAIAGQMGAMNALAGLGNSNMNFQDPAMQQGLANEWAQIQGGQGAPTFMGNGMQQGLMQQIMGQATNSGPGALAFDNGARQQEQYGNLRDIIAGGGATSIEMADRARQRGDSEAWLRGQREADMADYAERGLTGSGMELQSLAMDRQAAAGRNSLADLETAKALEERRLGAINSAAGLASTMRGNTIDEQSLLNNARTTGLNAATSLANTMRGQDFNERTYLDERMRDALGQRTDLSNTMRDQQLAEQEANTTARRNALTAQGNLATNARDSSFNEAESRAGAADDFAVLNQSAINNAASANTQFLQQAYTTMMLQRQQWQQNLLNQGINVAGDMMNFDQRENVTGFGQGTQIAGQTANQHNNAQGNYNSSALGVGTGANANTAGAQMAYNTIYPQLGQAAADWTGFVLGGAMNQGAQTGGGGLSTPGNTWAGSATGTGAATGAGAMSGTSGWNWNEINKQLGAK